MDRHCDNAELVAAFLDDHPRIAQVYFPQVDRIRDMTWPSGRCVATAAWSASAWLVAASSAPGLRGTSVIILGESLGGVESLIEHPHTMTHICGRNSVGSAR